jgi:protein O-GlcNAc transferase
MSRPFPQDAELLRKQGNAFREAGDLSAAVVRYRAALEIAPADAAALYTLALCLRELNDGAEAERLLRRVLEIDPDDGDARFHLGRLLLETARPAEAIPELRRALQRDPGNAALWMYLGTALARRHELGEAGDCLRKCVALEPGWPEAQFNLGNVHRLLGEHHEARAAYRRASDADPGNTGYRSALLGEMQQLCDWSGFDALCAQLRRELAEQPDSAVEPFALISIPSTRAEQLRCARAHARRLARSLAGERRELRFRRGPRDRLCIGYLSADFHEHATAYLAAELFELHDRARFRIHAYSYGPARASPMRARLERAFDRFVDVGERSDAAAAAAIHADGVDILVDMKGYTQFARSEIVALRCAPVQVAFLGYPGTMGADFVDYLVGDRFVTPPEHARDYSEAIVRLPDAYQVNDRRRVVAAAPARSSLGLPQQAFVFCAFNQPYKILPETFAVWMRLLESVAEGVLWLLDSNPQAAENLRAEAGRRGIDARRLVFAPKRPIEAHLARHAAADLFLDAFPCNAHTSASDALWAGLPVLTCAGETFASRVAGSLLRAAGLPELVTRSLAEYQALALRLARDRGEHAALRQRLLRGRATCALFDTPRFARHLEAAYEQMWRRYEAGEPPRAIDIAGDR